MQPMQHTEQTEPTAPSRVRRVTGFVRSDLVPLLMLAYQKWQAANSMLLGAAMAYYVLFSLFPLLLIILSIAALVVGATDSFVQQTLSGLAGSSGLPFQDTSGVQAQILQVLSQNVSPELAQQISGILDNLYRTRQQAGLIGLGILLFSASGAFSILDRAVDIIWEQQQAQRTNQRWYHSALTMALRKLLSFVLVLGLAMVVMVSLVLGTVVRAVSNVLQSLSGEVLLETEQWLAQFGISASILSSLQDDNRIEQVLLALTTVVLITGVLCILFKVLPSTRVAWGDVWLGAILTAGALAILNSLSSLFIGNSSFQNYGAIGSVMAFLSWMYLVNIVLFAGVAFTRAYALRYGSHREPEPQIASSEAQSTENAA